MKPALSVRMKNVSGVSCCVLRNVIRRYDSSMCGPWVRVVCWLLLYRMVLVLLLHVMCCECAVVHGELQGS